MPFISKCNSEDCIKIREFLTKLWTKLSWGFFIYAPCIRRKTVAAWAYLLV